MTCVLCHKETAERELAEFPQFRVCGAEVCTARANLFVDVITNRYVQQNNNTDDDDDEPPPPPPSPKRRKILSDIEDHAERVYWNELPEETLLHILFHFREDPDTLLALTETDRRSRSLALLVANRTFWSTPGPKADELSENEAALIEETAQISVKDAQRDEWALRSIKTFSRIMKISTDRSEALQTFIKNGVFSLVLYGITTWTHTVNLEASTILIRLIVGYKRGDLSGVQLLHSYEAFANATSHFTRPITDHDVVYRMANMMIKLAKLETDNWIKVTTHMQTKLFRAQARITLTKIILHHSPDAYRMAFREDSDIKMPIPENEARILYNNTSEVFSILRWYALSLWSHRIIPHIIPLQMRQKLQTYKKHLDTLHETAPSALETQFLNEMEAFPSDVSPWDYNGALNEIMFTTQRPTEWTTGATTLLVWILKSSLVGRRFLFLSALETAHIPFDALDAIYGALTTTKEKDNIDSILRYHWQFSHTDDVANMLLFRGINDAWLITRGHLGALIPYNTHGIIDAVTRALHEGTISLDIYLEIWSVIWKNPSRLDPPFDWWSFVKIVETHDELTARFPGGAPDFWMWIIENKSWPSMEALTDRQFLMKLLTVTAEKHLQRVREKFLLSELSSINLLQTDYGWSLIGEAHVKQNVQWLALIMRYFF